MVADLAPGRNCKFPISASWTDLAGRASPTAAAAAVIGPNMT